MAKARREVAECQRFRELGEQLLDVNEQICQLRPVEEPLSSAQEKMPEAIQKEVAELRSKTVLTVVESVELRRPYYCAPIACVSR